jgi:hypothetical protein
LWGRDRVGVPASVTVRYYPPPQPWADESSVRFSVIFVVLGLV